MEALYCPICRQTSSAADKRSAPYLSEAQGNRERKIIFCDTCGLGILNPPLRDEETAALYAGGQYWENHTTDVRLHHFAMPMTLAQCRWSYIQAHIQLPDTLRILDIGAGHGCLGMVAAQALGPRLIEYVAVEPDPRMRDRLEKIWPTYSNGVKLCVVRSLSEAPDTFGLVVLSHVLEHTHTPEALLNEVRGYLAPKGKVFIEVPNRDYRFKKNLEGHVLFFGPSQMERLLETQNFQRIDVSGFGKSPNSTPANPDNQRGIFQAVDLWMNRIKRFIPFQLFALYLVHIFGINQPNQEGTWVRAIGE